MSEQRKEINKTSGKTTCQISFDENGYPNVLIESSKAPYSKVIEDTQSIAMELLDYTQGEMEELEEEETEEELPESPEEIE